MDTIAVKPSTERRMEQMREACRGAMEAASQFQTPEETDDPAPKENPAPERADNGGHKTLNGVLSSLRGKTPRA